LLLLVALFPGGGTMHSPEDGFEIVETRSKAISDHSFGQKREQETRSSEVAIRIAFDTRTCGSSMRSHSLQTMAVLTLSLAAIRRLRSSPAEQHREVAEPIDHQQIGAGG